MKADTKPVVLSNEKSEKNQWRMGHPLVSSVPNLKYDIFGFIT